MCLDCLPLGIKMSSYFYDGLVGCQENSSEVEGCCGVLKCAEKQVIISAGHLLTAVFIDPIMIAYDMIMATFFILANVFTGFSQVNLRSHLMAHLLSSVGSIYEVFKNIRSAFLCQPPSNCQRTD